MGILDTTEWWLDVDAGEGYRLIKQEYDIYCGYYFLDKHGNVSGPYAYAEVYKDGFALVRERFQGPFRFRDKNGNLSREFEYARGFSEGFAVVKPNKEEKYFYMDTKGALTGGYCYAYDYHNGFAVIEAFEEDDSKVYRYRNKNGQLSQKFKYRARSFNDGFALVDDFSLMDENFKIIVKGTGYEPNTEYVNGFSTFNKNGEYYFRDKQGNLSEP